MNADTKLTFAAVCGAALAPALRGTGPETPLGSAPGGATALIYASCADLLGERVEAGEAVATALAHWIGEAEAVLAAYRGARADFLLIERRAAWAAPHAALAAISARSGAQAPEAQPLAAAPAPCGPVSRLVALCAFSQSPQALDLDAELAACALTVTPEGEEAARWTDPHDAPDLDVLTAEIRASAPPPGAHGALQAEAARLRDMLDHAQRRARADAARLAEQARKIETQHGIIRMLERDLGEAQGAARQVQKWLQSATPT